LKHAQETKPKPYGKIALACALAALVGLACLQAYWIFGGKTSADSRPNKVIEILSPNDPIANPSEEEVRLLEATRAGADPKDPNVLFLPLPLLASYGDLQIHSPIVPRDLTEIEFHQATYDTALRLTPLVTIVDLEEATENHGTKRIPYQEQPFGAVPLVAEAVSTWRLDSEGDEMTSIDVGATTGTVAYAPISGTVVKILTYSLYGLIDDYELHIQSPDYPELDILVLHLEQLTVKVGDEVIGGCTRIGKVRDLAAAGIDNNLMNITEPDDPGNHCHVQVNDATREDYRGLEGALDIFDGKGYARPAAPTGDEESSGY
jgi:hypothetical protein